MIVSILLGWVEDREAIARANTLPILQARVKQVGLTWPVKKLYFRAFKQERVLQIWGGEPGKMKLVRSYPVAAASGGPGPKRKEGDRQVPEGFYYIDRFNPRSRFHLSLGINYPNASDRILADRERPGGDIFIHGQAVSIGCLAMTDSFIEEIYTLARFAEGRIPVHIFPSRMSGSDWTQLQKNHSEWKEFWNEIRPAVALFDKSLRVPKFSVNRLGAYRVIR